MILCGLPIHEPVTREQRIEAAEDRADQAAFDVARDRSRGAVPCEHDALGCGDRTPHDEHSKVGDGRPCCGWPPRCE